MPVLHELPGSLDLLQLAAFVLAFAITFTLYTLYTSQRQGKLPLPPGPRPWPIIGNALDLPSESSWLTYTEWKKTYGDVIYVQAFGRPIVILNSYKAAHDLLDKKVSYADRPKFHMVGELMGWERYIPATQYGDKLRQFRRMMHGFMGKGAVDQVWPVQQAEVRCFLKSLLRRPEDFLEQFRLTAGKVIMNTAYGIRVGDAQDEYITLAEDAIGAMTKASLPGAYMVDVLPSLKKIPAWFPRADFKRNAVGWKTLSERMASLPYEHTKKDMAAGTAPPSFTQALLEGKKPNACEEEMIKYAAGTLYLGGADTTVSTISSFFLAMTIHPEVQREAQEELDSVIGPHALPTFEDRDKLPYINAIIKEVFRWAPVTPLCVPRAVYEDDIYEGYHIPAGSLVLPNVWAMSQDETMYPEPRKFIPERFLKLEKGLSDVLDPSKFAFGFGRRICAGMHFADAAVFITIASVLHSFNISKALDDAGNEITPAQKFTGGILMHPEPFKCKVTPRSNASIALVLGESEEGCH